MPALSPTRRNALLLVALLFAQLLLMAGSSRDAAGATMLELALMRLTRPLVGAAGSVADAGRDAASDTRSLFSARQDNQELRRRNRELRRRLDAAEELALQNERLRRLLDMRAADFPPSIGAAVVSATRTETARLLVINRGTDHGVRRDMAVVGWGGVVGRVAVAGAGLAKVQLLTDPSSSVAGRVQRNRVQGLVWGGADGPATMQYVPTFEDVMVGDRIVTSGREGIFPPGIGIGRVTFVGEGSSVSKRIELRPEVDFARLEEVLVILEAPGLDAQSLRGEDEGAKR